MSEPNASGRAGPDPKGADRSEGFVQPESFAFTAENRAEAERLMAKYPKGREASAIISLFYLAQAQSGGWLPQKAIEHVADLLGLPHIRAYEVATFYTMFNLKPVGRHFVQVCTTTPCWLRGSDEVLAGIREELGIGVGEMTADGMFSVTEVECLGACVNAPMVQINDDFYEDLDRERTKALLQAFKRGETPKTGSQSGRLTSAPEGGPTTLKDTLNDTPAGGERA